ncbi:uncharacterized protein N7483_002554 [Penicillium malachiteum]|uniref:uncharacterized protein n=1 Tax=Penicillium malachiteum TaxID=1324776 RepID=UPI0025467F52|nr:uncharacterized protein N7483_002554 [Penicillium malachiteum]KAJ5737429.1 hypothetical protein N7483_002554 [Penicillium malachiteum]
MEGACTSCHRSHRKCDKAVPCQSCIIRGKAEACVNTTRVSYAVYTQPEQSPVIPEDEDQAASTERRDRDFSLKTPDWDSYESTGLLHVQVMPGAETKCDEETLFQESIFSSSHGGIDDLKLPPDISFPQMRIPLLLVLGYLCVIKILPEDEATIWQIICRREQDWENAFLLQYDEVLYWLLSVRRALTQAQGLHAVTLTDIESQIRFLLYVIGIYSLPRSSFLQMCYQRSDFPYRPFGIKASIVLICLAFGVIRPQEIKNYEHQNSWPQDDSFLPLMTSRL